MRLKAFLVLVFVMLFLGACQLVAPSEPAKPEFQTSPILTPLSTTPEFTNGENSPLPPPVEATAEVEQNPPVATPLPTTGVGTETQNNIPDTARNAAIIFRRTGGIAGIDERWTIDLNGQITASSGQKGQVEPEQVQQLLKEIETLGFFEMNESYIPKNSCCDRFTYEITVHNGDKTQTVTTIDAAPEAPQALWQVIDAINRSLANSTQ